MAERYNLPEKPVKCPRCGSNRIANLLYGYPMYSEELETDRAAGRITLGGCYVTDDDPVWQCADCRVKIHQPGRQMDTGMEFRSTRPGRGAM